MRCWVAGALAVGVMTAGSAHAADMVTKAAPAAAAAAAAPGWTWTFDNQAQYVSWSSTRGWPNLVAGSGHGSEFYDPFGVTMSGSPWTNWNLEVTARGGWVSAHQSDGPFGGGAAALTDTTLSTTTTYTGINGWQPYLTVMTNLPTGESVLRNAATWAHMDPDIVPLATFGEGFNITPTVGITWLASQELSIVVNAGETWRGPYWKEGALGLNEITAPPDKVIPSNITTEAITATWQHDKWLVQGSASLAQETYNSSWMPGIGFMRVYKSGPRTTLSGSASYAWDQWWTTSVDGYFVHIAKQTVPNPLPALLLEPVNSNNDLFRINASQMYKTPFYNGTLVVGPVGSYMFRDHNGWDSMTGNFVPAKTYFAAGGSASYAPSDKLNLTARVQRFWLRTAVDPGALIPTINGNGWMASLSMTLNAP